MLVSEGVPIELIDRTMTGWGFPVGPVALLDEVGLDVAQKASAVMHEAFGDRMRPAESVSRLLAASRLGRKSGSGFYRYEGGRKAGVDASVYTLLGVRPVESADAIRIERRLVYSMLNEAALACSEGVVRSPRDGDVGALFGIGFPAFRGGPLRLLDDLGAGRVVETLRLLEDQVGPPVRAGPRPGGDGSHRQPVSSLLSLCPPGGRVPLEIMSNIADRLGAAIADRYLIKEEIGRGGAATVYLAEDLKHARNVAIKVLRPGPSGYEPQRFLREIRIAARLAHPHILPLHDSGESDGLLYFVMPYVGCETLRDRLDPRRHPSRSTWRSASPARSRPPWPTPTGRRHPSRHQAREHPARRGQPVVADFGVATALSARARQRLRHRPGLAVGTPEYMSPEQASAEQDLDGRSDTTASRCVLYEMLGRRAAVRGTGARATMARQAIETPRADPRPPARACPPSIERVVSARAGEGARRAVRRHGRVLRRADRRDGGDRPGRARRARREPRPSRCCRSSTRAPTRRTSTSATA